MWVEKLLQNINVLVVDLLYVVGRKVALGIFFHDKFNVLICLNLGD